MLLSRIGKVVTLYIKNKISTHMHKQGYCKGWNGTNSTFFYFNLEIFLFILKMSKLELLFLLEDSIPSTSIQYIIIWSYIML